MTGPEPPGGSTGGRASWDEDTQPITGRPDEPTGTAPGPSFDKHSSAESASADTADTAGTAASDHGAAKAARTTGRMFTGAAKVTGRAGRFAFRQARRAARAEGAGDSGLSRLIELHAVHAAGDAAVAISLAGTLFFQVPTEQARGQVALFLAMTMLPFAIVAPLIGPFLDRFSHGRRWAIGATTAIRGFLCWVLAGAVITNSTWLFPAALGCLVASKSYSVARAAAVPRLVPENLTLVKANGRTSLAGVIGAAVSAPIAGAAALIGPEWSLRYAFVLFVIATILAILLPARVDSSVGEGELVMRGEDGEVLHRGRPRLKMRIPRSVSFALRANCGPRWMSGFLTMFMAFLLREHSVGGLDTTVALGVVVGAAGLGNTLGIALASVLKKVNPSVTVIIALAADAAMAVVTALFYGVLTVALLGLTAGMAQSLAKLSLDSTIQRDVPERVRTSAFARSDTALQMAWVLGGFVGIAMPLWPEWGLGAAGAVLVAWLVLVLVKRGPARPAATTAAPA